MYKNLFILLCFIGSLSACNKSVKQQQNDESEQMAVLLTMEKHLAAVSNKDSASLAETLSPSGHMQLILPSTEIIPGVDGFMKYHNDWFKNPDWTFETRILNSKVGSLLAMVIVEIVYQEPLRDGKPYFNRMTVSYVLEKTEGQWYVIKDHASSVQKSTDKQ